MTIGIYALYFDDDPDYRAYIGQSLTLEDRYKGHLAALKGNRHHNHPMQKAFNSGIVKLDYILLEETKANCLDEREIFWIRHFSNKCDSLFNMNEGGQGPGSNSGHTSPHALYTKEQYIEIFKLLAIGNTHANVSRTLNVSYDIVRSIYLFESHVWLHTELPEQYSLIKDRHNNTRERPSEETLLEILNTLATTNTSIADASKIHNVSLGVVKNIVNGKCYHFLKDSHLYKDMLEKQKNRRSVSARKGKEYPPIISPTGDTYIVTNVREFSETHGLHQSAVCKVLNGKVKTHLGWKLK